MAEVLFLKEENSVGPFLLEVKYIYTYICMYISYSDKYLPWKISAQGSWKNSNLKSTQKLSQEMESSQQSFL